MHIFVFANTIFVLFCILIDHAKGAVATTTSCPLRCPPGWINLAGSGNNQCYLLPPVPVPQGDFWWWQNYCVQKQPTSYVVAVNTNQELAAGGVKALTYLAPYLPATWYLWLGAYYENGAFHWMDGHPWTTNYVVVNPLSPPTNGSCVVIDPKSPTLIAWYYKPCSNQLGATVCEMAPIPDCSGTTLPLTTTTPYSSPDCDKAKMADFVKQQQAGYMSVPELMTLTGMDVTSCAVACIYYSGCYSFDIINTGDCRLLGDNNMFSCGTQFTPDDNYQHYDMLTIT